MGFVVGSKEAVSAPSGMVVDSSGAGFLGLCLRHHQRRMLGWRWGLLI
jgi:hypothetical protein